MSSIFFTPSKINQLEIPNRFVMAPMTRSFSPNGAPDENVADYYGRRAQGGVGLIVTEGVHVNLITAKGAHPQGVHEVPNLVTDAAKAGWRRVTDKVHGAGGLIAAQIWNEGPFRDPATTKFPEVPSWSPSGINKEGEQVWPPMSDLEIATAIEEFASAAVAAKEAGFDAIEVHGAHSYLIDSFFWGKTNQRTDKWGGDIGARTRFATEILKEIRKRVGSDYPVIVRLSQWKQQEFDAKVAQNPDELLAWLSPLADAGADGFHLSQRRFWEPEFDGSELNFAGWAKKLTGLPAITVGSVGLTGEFTASFGGEVSKPASIEALVQKLEASEFDFVAVGRALLQDPNWVQKIRDGETDKLLDYDVEALKTLS